MDRISQNRKYINELIESEDNVDMSLRHLAEAAIDTLYKRGGLKDMQSLTTMCLGCEREIARKPRD